jgi:hypothetical protein
MVMTGSDLCANAKPWHLQLETVSVIYEEFYIQVLRAEALTLGWSTKFRTAKFREITEHFREISRNSAKFPDISTKFRVVRTGFRE